MKKETVIQYYVIIYKSLFVLLMLLSAVPFVHEIISPYIRLILIPGLLLVAYDFFLGNRKLWKTKYIWILFAFIISYVITILLNRELHFSENIKALLYMAVIFSTLYAYNPEMSEKDKEKEIKAVYTSFLAGTFVLSAICFFTYIFSWNIKYMNGETPMYIGMYDNRLWGLYNPNTGATLNVLSIMISLMIWEKIKNRKRAGKILLGLNIGLQVLCLVLTHSRAPIFLGMAGIAAYIVFAVLKNQKLKKKKRSYIKGFLLGIALMFAFLISENVLRETLSYIPPLLKNTSIAELTQKSENKNPENKNPENKNPGNKKTGNQKTNTKKVDLGRKEKEEERAGGTLTGRGDLWQAGIKGFLDKPLFGSSRENVYADCEQYLKDDTWQSSLDVGGLHNIYLTVLVSSGVVGFMVLLFFVAYSLKYMFVYIFNKKGMEKNVFFRGNLIMLLQFAGMEMMEARILYRVGIFYVMFFIIYGYVMYDAQKENEKENGEKSLCRR